MFQPTGLNAFLGGIGPWNWPIPFKKVSINGRLFDPLALVPLGMSPLASFYRFYLPSLFTHPPLAPLPRCVQVWRFTGPHSAASLAEQWEAKLPALLPIHASQPASLWHCSKPRAKYLGPTSWAATSVLKNFQFRSSSLLFFFSAPRLLPSASRSESEATSAWADLLILSKNDTSKSPPTLTPFDWWIDRPVRPAGRPVGTWLRLTINTNCAFCSLKTCIAAF